MERDNFFIILDLSVDPPQMDPSKIEEAIKKKQSEWSRLRNPPTKGIKAQSYIGMIPEIRRVMMNSELCEKEAKSALEIIKNKKQFKFKEIDRHLELLMSKGFIKEEEIFKLAKHHGISVSEIRSRIKLKEEEKFSVLDQQIHHRGQKGYITESEIDALSVIHSMDKKTIRKRITCPVKKDKTTRFQKAKPIDPSIIKIIEENLKIVGKTSLYDFLGVNSDAEIKELQQRAKEKEADILKIRKKDALTTASGVLVGHCIFLFKNEQNKASYDNTRIQAQLSKLNMDIDVTGIEGIIRADNFQYLVNRAVEFGLSPKEATSYIKNYCKHKKWHIETPLKKKDKTKKLLVKIITIILIFSGIAFYGFYSFNQHKLKNEYESLIVRVENQENLEDKIYFLKNYLDTNPVHKYSRKIQKQYEEYEKKLGLRQYNSLVGSAEKLISQKKFDEAMALYVQYKNINPQSPFKDDIAQKMILLSEVLEDRDYEILEQKVLNLSAQEKILEYRKHQKKYPRGNYHKSINAIVSDLGDIYYFTLMDELRRCESDKTWEKCIQLSAGFINAFPNDPRSEKLQADRDKYRQYYREEMVLRELNKRAGEKGSDYGEARKIFLRYMQLNPHSSITERIQEEIVLLEKAEKEALRGKKLKKIMDQIKAADDRFVVRDENIVLDKHTKLMWTLWDSADSGAVCIDYKTAHQYVSDLRTGGYSDWRLPTPQELIRLYKTEPFFPLTTSEWYWTSVNYRSYIDGWVQMVDTIITGPVINNYRERVDSRRCGAVRAVRP